MMQSMSEDDAAYTALLKQLLSDSAPCRNARVHSWIEHQYDFVLSEQPFASSRPPSPSPSSSLGAHRAYSIDRPDSPLLPRFSSERPSSPCPSYDALFFPCHSKSDDDDFEEQERIRALRFIVQEMAHSTSNVDKVRLGPSSSSPSHPPKPLPAPPPSPASSLTQSTSSRAMRSRSSSTRISRLPSFTSTLSSDQSHPHEIPPPLPVSVIVHGEYQHDLVLSRDLPLIDGYLHKRDDSQDAQFLCPIPDDLDSALHPSPTFSSFSCAHSRDTSCTTPFPSSPASPTSVVFFPCPENIALPSSPMDENHFSLRESLTEPIVPPSSSSRSLPLAPPKATIFPTSLASPLDIPGSDSTLHPLRAPKSIEYSQSRWSIATTASLAPSTAEPRQGGLLNPRSSPKDKGLKTPKKRTRFISLISRLSPGRSDPPLTTTTTTQSTDDVDYDSANDTDSEDKDKKPRKSLSKKSSLASLRASFSISRASFSSQRPPASSFEEVPPLPTSPTLSSPLADCVVPVPRPSISRVQSRANLMHTPLPPIPQSASSTTSFHSPSRISISDTSAESRGSRNPSASASRTSLLPAPSKRTSLASAAGLEPLLPASQATVRSKSIFRLTAKPKTLKAPITSVTKAPTMMPSRLPLAGNASLSSATVRSRIPQSPAKFIPPAKLATVIATQSRQATALTSAGPICPASKLPMPPSRIPPKVPRPVTTSEKPPPECPPPSSRLPMPASVKGTRVGTVKGFWKRQ